jgi:hypothetical protein
VQRRKALHNSLILKAMGHMLITTHDEGNAASEAGCWRNYRAWTFSASWTALGCAGAASLSVSAGTAAGRRGDHIRGARVLLEIRAPFGQPGTPASAGKRPASVLPKREVPPGALSKRSSLTAGRVLGVFQYPDCTSRFSWKCATAHTAFNAAARILGPRARSSDNFKTISTAEI